MSKRTVTCVFAVRSLAFSLPLCRNATESEQIGFLLAEHSGCAPADVSCFRNLSVAALLQAQEAAAGTFLVCAR